MWLIVVRYALPILFCCAMIGVFFIPCAQFSTADGTNSPISGAELFDNSWYHVREYLFSGGATEASQERFCQIMLGLLIALAILFALGAASTVIVAFFAFRFMADPERGLSDTARLWFVSVIPNRIVVCALQALTLPVLFLTRMMVPLYDKVMHTSVLLNVTSAEPWVYGLILFGVSVALSVVSAHFEKKLGLDVFKKRVIVKTRAGEGFGAEDSDVDDNGADERRLTAEERRYMELQRKNKEEQEERIRKLLNKDTHNDR